MLEPQGQSHGDEYQSDGAQHAASRELLSRPTQGNKRKCATSVPPFAACTRVRVHRSRRSAPTASVGSARRSASAVARRRGRAVLRRPEPNTAAVLSSRRRHGRGPILGSGVAGFPPVIPKPKATADTAITRTMRTRGKPALEFDVVGALHRGRHPACTRVHAENPSKERLQSSSQLASARSSLARLDVTRSVASARRGSGAELIEACGRPTTRSVNPRAPGSGGRQAGHRP